jgi:histone H3/H4
MVKAQKGSAASSAGTLKSPSSALTSKNDDDKDADKDKTHVSEKSSATKSAKGAFRQFLSKKDLKALKKAKAAGGAAWESAKAQVRLKLTPPEYKSKSARANTAMPVKKLKARLQASVPKDRRVTTEAAVALAAVLDYAVSELVDNACQACELKKQRTITARHIKLGVPQDESLAELFKGVTIPQGGTVPTFHPELAQGYRKKKTQRPVFADAHGAKELSSPSVGGKKGMSEAKPASSGDDASSVDPKKDKPGASSSSPAEK